MKTLFSFYLTWILSLMVLPALLTGQNHALIFAVEQHQNGQKGAPDAIQDAIALGAVLSSRFNFQVEVVENPTGNDIHNKLKEYRQRFAEEKALQESLQEALKAGQLMIYFLGRGAEENGVGYFLPADASALAWHQLLAEISQFDCQHILVAADAAYSGAIGAGGGNRQPAARPFLEKGQYQVYLQNRKLYPTRLMLALDPRKKRDTQGPSLSYLLWEGLNKMAEEYSPVSMGHILAYMSRWAGEVATAYSFQGDGLRSNFVFSKWHIQPAQPRWALDEESLWRQVTQLDSFEAYSLFTWRYPNSQYRAEAYHRMGKFANFLYTDKGRILEVSTASSSIQTGDFIRARGGVFTPSLVKTGKMPPNGIYPGVVVREFYLSPNEVTIAAFEAFCWQTRREAPPKVSEVDGNSPVTNVSWYDALEYCNWLSNKHGLQMVYEIEKAPMDPENLNLADPHKWIITFDNEANGYRLPTTAEWEYAACIYSRNRSAERLGKMGSRVQEWCWDWETFGYHQSVDEVFNPRGPRRGAFRSIRGDTGGRGGYAQPCASPYAGAPTLRRSNLGFRVVRGER